MTTGPCHRLRLFWLSRDRIADRAKCKTPDFRQRRPVPLLQPLALNNSPASTVLQKAPWAIYCQSALVPYRAAKPLHPLRLMISFVFVPWIFQPLIADTHGVVPPTGHSTPFCFLGCRAGRGRGLTGAVGKTAPHTERRSLSPHGTGATNEPSTSSLRDLSSSSVMIRSST